MLIDTTLFVGVDPSGGRNPFTFAAFDQNGKLVELNGGEMEDVLSYLTGKPGVVVAVNAARRPSTGLVRRGDVRQNLPPLHVSGRSLDMRLAEHQLRQHGINISMTPSKQELCSSWVQVGFDFYNQLEACDYKNYPDQTAPYQVLETHPHASYCALLGQSPIPRTALEGRLQRQLALYEQGMIVRDPMNFFEEITRHKLLRGVLPLEQVYTCEELDAIIAAYVAFVAGRHPDRILKLGDAQEGQIILPVTQLKEKY